MKGRGLFRKPLRRLTVLLLVVAIVIGGIVWFFGLGIAQSVVVVAAVAGVGLTWLAVQEGESVDWPLAQHQRSPGARRDVQTLGWSMKTRGGVHEKTLARAREAARHRLLFLYGLDLYDEGDRLAIEQFLAPGVVRTLLAPRRANLDLTAFNRVLKALEALGDTDATTTSIPTTTTPSTDSTATSTERHR